MFIIAPPTPIVKRCFAAQKPPPPGVFVDMTCRILYNIGAAFRILATGGGERNGDSLQLFRVGCGGHRNILCLQMARSAQQQQRQLSLVRPPRETPLPGGSFRVSAMKLSSFPCSLSIAPPTPIVKRCFAAQKPPPPGVFVDMTCRILYNIGAAFRILATGGGEHGGVSHQLFGVGRSGHCLVLRLQMA